MEKPKFPDRKRLRWNDFNYRSSGGYFITLCTHQREKSMAQVRGARLILTRCGEIVLEEWKKLPTRFPGVLLDQIVILPDHLHAILFIARDQVPSLSVVVGAWKSASSLAINKWRSGQGKPFWQRSFFDRVLRDEAEWILAKEYIRNNPQRWIENFQGIS